MLKRRLKNVIYDAIWMCINKREIIRIGRCKLGISQYNTN